MFSSLLQKTDSLSLVNTFRSTIIVGVAEIKEKEIYCSLVHLNAPPRVRHRGICSCICFFFLGCLDVYVSLLQLSQINIRQMCVCVHFTSSSSPPSLANKQEKKRVYNVMS